ncbi:MAG: hypothetical protein D6706_04080 [Chloroflexi bacterium]|nr:MAG: hypothetical protein D6706_04080 [Chloroflexota bacterium]
MARSKLVERLFWVAGQAVLDWPVRGETAESLARMLQRSGEQIIAHAQKVADTPFNRRVLSHIVGIERWGQSRLQVALGAPLVMDEYNGYRPPRERTLPALISDFEETRSKTIALIDELAQENVSFDFTIPHNSYGLLSVRAWLRYLEMHARLESRKMK